MTKSGVSKDISVINVSPGCVVNCGPGSGSAVTIKWNREVGGLEIVDHPAILGQSPSRAHGVASALFSAFHLSGDLEYFYALTHSAPQGMVPRRVVAPFRRYTRLTVAERRLIRKAFPESLLRDVAFPVKPAHAEKSIGYFSPQADPTRAGTPFIFPRVDPGVRGIYWCLGYVNMNSATREEAQMAAWNDAAGIARLVSACMEADPEYNEAVALLSGSDDSKQIAEAKEEAEWITAARAAFRPRKMRINNSNIAAIISDATRLAAKKAVNTHGSARYYTPQCFEVIDLLPKKGGDLADGGRAMNVGAIYRFSSYGRLTAVEAKSIVAEAERALTREQAGELLIGSTPTSPSSAPLILVARDAALAEKYLTSIPGVTKEVAFSRPDAFDWGKVCV